MALSDWWGPELGYTDRVRIDRIRLYLEGLDLSQVSGPPIIMFTYIYMRTGKTNIHVFFTPKTMRLFGPPEETIMCRRGT